MPDLTQTIKNFISSCTENLLLRGIDLAFPLMKAIERNDLKKVEKYAKKLKEEDFASYMVTAANAGRLDCLKILIETFKTKRTRQQYLYNRAEYDNVLLAAIEKDHTKCALYVLDQCQTVNKHQALSTAIQRHNDEFVIAFLPTIPAHSVNWPSVLNEMAFYSNTNLLLAAFNACKTPHIEMQLESETREKIAKVIAEQQKAAIEQQLDMVSNNCSKMQRKM